MLQLQLRLFVFSLALVVPTGFDLAHGFGSESEDPLHEIHEQMEELPASELTGLRGWLWNWARAFDPRNYVSNIYRSYHMEENEEHRHGYHDILFLFSMSHPLEMAAGPILTVFGISHGFDTALAAGTLAGYIISIPGLDPLCILLSGTYLLPASLNLKKAAKLDVLAPDFFKDRELQLNWSPIHKLTIVPYRALVRGMRHVVWGVPAAGLKALGAPKLWRMVRTRENRIDIIQSQKRVSFYESKEGRRQEVVVKTKSGKPWLALELKKSSDEKSHYVSRLLLIEKPDKQARKDLSALGWNVKSIVKESIKRRERPEILGQRFFVESANIESHGILNVSFKAGAIRLNNRTRLKSPIEALISLCSRPRRL